MDDDKIQQFYSSFEDNKKMYEEENADTVDVLFTMINFDAFKTRMLVAKKGMVDVDSNSTEDAADKNAFTKVNISDQYTMYK